MVSLHSLVDSNVNWNPDGTFRHTRCFVREDTGRKVCQSSSILHLQKCFTIFFVSSIDFGFLELPYAITLLWCNSQKGAWGPTITI